MTIAFRSLSHISDVSSRALMERALEPHILIGMPHLTPDGLSETWLMKELGHRHWLILARQLGMDNADFRTDAGEEAYAAICATSMTDACLESVGANDILTIYPVTSAVSRTQTSTRFELSVAGRPVGTVELLSTFVRREIAGRNRSIARVALRDHQARQFIPSPLAKTAADIRCGRLQDHWGQLVLPIVPLRTFRFRPSVTQEFNGAGLFYFAEFQALAERALDDWFPHRRAVSRRDMFFLGNVEKGESLLFELLQGSETGATFHGQIRRETGDVIARMFAVSRPLP